MEGGKHHLCGIYKCRRYDYVIVYKPYLNDLLAGSRGVHAVRGVEQTDNGIN